MLTEEERKRIVRKASERILKNLDAMKGYAKFMYLQKLVDMLDDTHLIAIDFSIEMTPEQLSEKEGEQSL